MSQELAAMASTTKTLETAINKAVERGQLLPSAAENMSLLLRDASSPVYEEAVTELITREEWAELNDRFFKTLTFGTGGLRGRTIGKIVAEAEHGKAGKSDRPQFPCVGTNAMNFFNVSRATQGLVAYLHQVSSKDSAPTTKRGRAKRPKIVIACDSRHFSKEFTELAAKTAAENGCDACVFEGPRSTPELSFAVRDLNADAGIVITASHNPPHDNGYKVYFDDGAQVVEPHASGIIAEVNAITNEDYVVEEQPGRIVIVGDEVDRAYMDRLETLI